MIKTRDEIATIYQNRYPNLESHYVEIFDPEFIVPKFDDFMAWLKKYSVAGISHIPNRRDCDKRAKKVVADIQWHWAMMKEIYSKKEQYGISIGWLSGYLLPFGTEHVLITGLFDVGIRNIDPLTDTIEEVNLNKFNALLLVM